MELTTIYNDLMEIIKDNMNIIKADALKEKLEKAIREETCYKSTPKTRVNAMKKIASKDRPNLMGYGIHEDYKMITDSYHAVIIKGDCPLKLVSTDKELIEKVGKENCIIGDYPNLYPFFDRLNNQYAEYTKIKLDYNDIMQFYKLHKKHAKEELYEIKWDVDGREFSATFNIEYLKNVIDVIGTEADVYIESDHTPLFIVNKDGEKGIVLPVKTY